MLNGEPNKRKSFQNIYDWCDLHAFDYKKKENLAYTNSFKNQRVSVPSTEIQKVMD